jgi:hypothetical protein
MDAMIALFVTQVIDFSTYWPILGMGHWVLGIGNWSLINNSSSPTSPHPHSPLTTTTESHPAKN